MSELERTACRIAAELWGGKWEVVRRDDEVRGDGEHPADRDGVNQDEVERNE